jgi:hypothetical protein
MCSVTALLLSLAISADIRVAQPTPSKCASAASSSRRPKASSKSSPANSWRVGLAPFAGSASPAAISDGMLAGDIDWLALERDASLPKCLHRHADKPMKSILLEYFMLLHLKNFAVFDLNSSGEYESLNPNMLSGAQISAIVCSSMTHDKFVKPVWSQELFEILQKSVPENTYSKLHWNGGGHVQGFLYRKQFQLGAILEVLRELHTL